MPRCILSVLILIPCLLVGCSRSPNGAQGNVAVVDLDQVAQQLGLSDQWSSQLAARKSNVNQQLAGYQQQLNDQLQQKRAEIVPANTPEAALPEEGKMQLVSYQQELNGKLRRAQKQAQKHIQVEQTQIIHAFRRQAEQVSAEIARQQGYDVVLTKNQSVVLTFNDAADITQDVANLLQSQLVRREQVAPATAQSR